MMDGRTSNGRESNLAFFAVAPEERAAAAAALAQAKLLVVNRGPWIPSLLLNLARLGFRDVRFVGDRPITALDVQQSRHYRREDIGASTSAALAALAGSSLRLEPVGFPASKLEWQERLAGVSLAIVPSWGPVLFLPWLDLVNEATQDAGVPFITCAHPSLSELHIGPTIVPGETACYKCFEMRFKSHISNYESYVAFETFMRANDAPVDFGFFPPLADVAGAIVATEAARAVLPGQTPYTLQALVTFDATTFAFETHPLLPLPRCQVCSPARNAPNVRRWA
jgi:bacteriocin biosynthesis cyclodehydratase domain-containing protein